MAKYRTLHRGYIVVDGNGKPVLTEGGNLIVYNRISQAVMSTSGPQQRTEMVRIVGGKQS